jgi:hypothetical protein
VSIFFTGQNIRNLTSPEQEKIAAEAQMKANDDRRNALRRDLPDFFDEPSWAMGLPISGYGTTILSAANKMGMNLFSNGDELYEIPLNTDTKEQPDPEAFMFSPSSGRAPSIPNTAGGPLETDPYIGKNNLEGLIEMTDGIPDEDRMYILSAPNWGEFKDRLMLYRMHDPNIDAELAYASGSTAPIWTSFGTDATALTALGFATEPLAWVGTGTRIAQAGEAAAVAARAGTISEGVAGVAARTLIAETVSAMPATLRMTEMVGRYAALGVIDQTVINAGRFGFDNFYHREASEILTEYAFSAALGGVMGGVTASKTIANNLVRAHAESVFNTLPITKVTAETSTATAAAATASGVGLFSSAVKAQAATIGNDAARTLVVQLEKVGLTPELFLRGLKRMGYIEDHVGSLKNIPNDPKLIASINRLIEVERVIKEYPGKVVKIRGGSLGKAGARILGKRLSTLIGEAPEAFTARLNSNVPEDQQGRVVARMLIEDMNEAGYKVDSLADISNSPDVLAKIDAWIEAKLRGENTPFGFRRNPAENATPSQPFTGANQPSTEGTAASVAVNAPTPVQDQVSPGTSQKPTEASAETTLTKKFTDLADSQRRDPEAKMREVQKATGGNTLDTVVEHGGDLIHRMSSKAEYAATGAPEIVSGRFDILPKLKRVLGALKTAGGFEAQILSDFKNSATASRTAAEIEKDTWAALKEFGDAHKALPAYNEVQRLARDAMVDIGNMDWAAAEEKLSKLLSIAEDPERFYKIALSDDGVEGSALKATEASAPAANAVPTPPPSSSVLGTDVLPLSQNPNIADLPAPVAGASPDEAAQAAVPRNNVAVPLVSRELNQSAAVLQSKNPLLRLFGFRAFWARRVLVDPATGAPLPQPMTVYESSKQLLDAVMMKTIKYKDHYFRKFVFESGVPFREKFWNYVGAGRNRTMLDFEKRVRSVIRTGTPDSSASVNKFAASYKDLLKSTAAEAERLGIDGFEAYRMLDNYFPRTYVWETIQRLGSTTEGRKALVSLFEKLLETRPGLREVRVLNSLTGQYDTLKFADIPDAAEALVDRMIRLAVDGENAPYMDFETALIQSVEGVQGPFKELQKSKSPRGRTRILMNEQAQVPLTSDLLGNGKTTLDLDDITHGDLTFAMKKYATSVMGIVSERRFLNQIEADLARMGYKSSIPHGPTGQPVKFNTIAEFIEFIQDRGSKNPDWGPATSEEIAMLERISHDLTFKPRVDAVPMKAGKYALPSNISYAAIAGASVLKANAFLLYAGMFALAQAAEIGRPLVVLGPTRVISNIPIAISMLKRWALLDVKQQGQIALLDQFAIASDRIRRTIYNTPQAEIMFSRKGKIRRILGKTADIYSDVSLLGPLTSFTQIVTGLSKLQYLYDVGAGVSKALDNQTIRALGVTPEQFAKAAEFIKNNAVVVKRFGKNTIVDINNMNHPDFDYVRTLMDRMVKSRVQDVATSADTGAWADNPFGALFAQFRNYNLKAVDNLLLQNYSRIYNGAKGEKGAAASKVAQEVGAAFLLAGLLKQAVTIGDHHNAEEAKDFVRADELKSKIGLKGLALQGVLGPGELWLPAMAAEAAWSLNPWTEDPLLSQYRYSGTDMLTFPALQMTKDYYGVAKDVLGAGVKELSNDDGGKFSRDITRQTLLKAQRLIWFNNYKPIQYYLNIKREEISDFYDLPYEQLRRD